MPTRTEQPLASACADVPWILVGGKGGAGKTTVAAATAIALADAGEQVLVMSVDPAHSLGDALGMSLDGEPRDVPDVPRLRAMELDATAERARWLSRRRNSLATLLEQGTALARAEIEELMELSLPGADELAAMLRLAELAAAREVGRLVVDTAPTGHALRMLETPQLATGWAHTLRTLDERRRVVAEAMTHQPLPRGDAVRALLDELDSDLGRLSESLADPAFTRCLLVTNPEPVVHAETLRYREALSRAGVAIAALVVNRYTAAAPLARDDSLWPAVIHVPLADADPCGPTALRALADSAGGAAPARAESPRASQDSALVHVQRARWVPDASHRLYFVAGKGGVGKTTVAGAMAAVLATEQGRRTLLLSVDPAGSLGDVWECQVGDRPTAVPGAPLLQLRQLDAAAAWDAFRRSSRDGLAAVLAELAGDESVLPAQAAELGPAGMDELVALAELSSLIDDPTYEAIVVDTAPTGHLLRLLEAPALAREWSHAVLRILLRYRQVAGLGEFAERVLRFAREVKALEQLLSDRSRTMLAVVALPERLSVSETGRLLNGLRSRDVHPSVLIVNRLLDDAGDGRIERKHAPLAAELLALEQSPDAVATPAMPGRPTGLRSLQLFAQQWRRIDAHPAPQVAA
jgi:arsenite/tail-anchored protein-transporting ATPase